MVTSRPCLLTPPNTYHGHQGIHIGIDILTGLHELKAQYLRALLGSVVGMAGIMGYAVKRNVVMGKWGLGTRAYPSQRVENSRYPSDSA